jgi:hypothetical protein
MITDEVAALGRNSCNSLGTLVRFCKRVVLKDELGHHCSLASYLTCDLSLLSILLPCDHPP